MNYGELKSHIADWLMRGDLTSVIPTFVRLTEGELNRDLRVRQMLVRAVSTVEPFASGSTFISLPTDFLEARNVQFNTDRTGVRSLCYLTLQEADKLRASGATGKAYHYTIHASDLEFVPPLEEDTPIELTYYARIPELTDDADTNWLLTDWPDIYLYGSLLQASPYLRDDDRVPMWQSIYEKAIEKARVQDDRAEVSGSTLRRRFNAIG